MVEITKVCPECGKDMSKLDAEGHSLSHFPDYLDPAKSSKLSIKRQKQIQSGGVSPAEYSKAHAEGE